MYRSTLRVSEAINLRSGQLELLRQFPQYGVRRYSNRPTYLNELNDFDTSLPSLVFGNKRLVTAELLCQVLLSEARPNPGRSQ